MSITIKRQIVSDSIARQRTYGNGNQKRTITVHQTGNTNRGANAQAHANIQSRLNPRQASWHYSVDDKEIIQSYEDSAQCWHASDGRGPGNLHSISIEICINSDGDYVKSVENGAKLVKHLIEKYGLSIGDVKQHYDWSRKNCPAQIRAGKDGINWTDFLSMVEGSGKKVASVTVKTSTPKKMHSKTSSNANLSVDGKWGNGTTRALQRALGTPQDGIISGQPKNSVTQSLYGSTVSYGRGGSVVIRALQKKVGAKQDGLLGPATVRALQRYLGTVQDGKLSRPSLVVKELQRRLNAGTF